MNTVIYAEDWRVKLQERLDYPQTWREMCKVEITNERVLHNPYMSTVPAVQVHTRDSAYTHQTLAITDEYITINQSGIWPITIDRADLAQSTYVKQMDMAELAGTMLNEYIETDMLANHAMWTDFDNEDIGGVAGNITVSVTTIPKIVRGILREIREHNGSALAKKNGVGIVWRPQDFEKLEEFAQANGFVTADHAIKDGLVEGFYYMGVYHYVSNSHTAGHVFAGVRNIFHVGLVSDTYGDVVIDEEPATSGGALSAIGIVSRVDWEFKAWTNTTSILYDVLVA